MSAFDGETQVLGLNSKSSGGNSAIICLRKGEQVSNCPYCNSNCPYCNSNCPYRNSNCPYCNSIVFILHILRLKNY